jgi:autotransporter-associated beta strand protein
MREPITIAIALFTALLAQGGRAATVYWDGGDEAIWNFPANWSTHPTLNTPDPLAAPGAGDIATFNREFPTGVVLLGNQAVMGLAVQSSPTGATIPILRSRGSTGGTDGVKLSIGAGGITVAALAIVIGDPNPSESLNISIMDNQTWSAGVGSSGFIVYNQVSLGVPGAHTLTLGGATMRTCNIYGAISDGAGALSLQVAGSDRTAWDLYGVNTYTGPTTVTSGTLSVAGVLTNTNAVEVGSGGVLRGHGSINPLAPVIVRGTLNAGLDVMTIATLGMGSVSMESGATLRLDIDTTNLTSDRIVIDGNLSLDSDVTLGLWDFQVNATPLEFGTTFTFIDYSGSWNGGLFSVGDKVIADDVDSFTLGKNTYAINYNGGVDGNDVQLVVVVPEPGAAATLLSGCGILLISRRRRVQRRAALLLPPP